MRKQKLYTAREGAKERKRKLQMEEQRIRKHQRLIELIKHYYRSEDDEERLRKIRVNTMTEIQLRFRKASINKKYTFPRNSTIHHHSQQSDESYSNATVIYDLRQQNSTIFKENSQRIVTLSTGRRVKSLGQSRGEESPRINKKAKRIETILNPDEDPYYRQMKRWNTNPKNIKLAPLELPKIKRIERESSKKGKEMVQKKLVTEGVGGRKRKSGVLRMK